MQWVETDTSTNGDRWTLENELGIPIILMVRSIADGNAFDGYNYRIFDTVSRLNAMPIEEAKEQIIRHLKLKLKTMLAKL